MAFVRMDLQITEEEAVAVAKALSPLLNGFEGAFKQMMDAGPDAPDGHMAILYRSLPVQHEMQRQGFN